MTTRTQQKQRKKAEQARQAEAYERASFVAQLARDLFVTGRYTPHEAMEQAIQYFEALQTFRRPTPAPAPVPAPVDANGSPVELEG